MATGPLKVDGVLVDEAIATDQEILKSMQEDHRHRPGTLDHLGRLFFIRYEAYNGERDTISDLCDAIASSTAALALLAENDFGRHRIGLSIGHRYWLKFLRTNEIDDIDKAILFTQDAMLSTPETDISPRLQMTQALGDHYSFRTQVSSGLDDAVKAIELYAIVAAGNFPERGGNDRLWQNIAANFKRILNRTNHLHNCDVVVDAASKILCAMEKPDFSVNDEYRDMVRVGLARTLLLRYTRTQSIEDLSRSKDIYEDLLKGWSPQNSLFRGCTEDLVSVAKFYISHSSSLQGEFELSRDKGVLLSALEAALQAFGMLSHGSNEEDLASAAETKSGALLLSYDTTKHFPTLKQAFDMASLALQKTKPSDLASAPRFEKLSRCFAKMQHKNASLNNMNEIWSMFKTHLQSLNLFSEERAAVMEAAFLVELYDECGLDPALDHATDLYKATSVDLMSWWEVFALRNHARVSSQRYNLKRTQSDLEIAFKHATLALKIDNDKGYQSWDSCHLLGSIKSEMFLATGNLGDLEDAIDLATRSLDMVPRGQSATHCMNLGNNYGWRFDALGAGEDIVRALELCKQSLDPTRGDGPSLRPTKINNYGEKLLAAYYHTDKIEFLNDSIEQGAKVEKLWRTMSQTVNNLFWISNYAIRLSRRATVRERKGDREGAELDIDYAINLTAEAYHIAVKHNSRPLRAAMANNLASRYSSKAKLKPEYYSESMRLAINSAREAVRYTDSSSPGFCHRARNLADYLASFALEEPDHDEEVIRNYTASLATETASARQRLITVQSFAKYLIKVGEIQTLDSQLDLAMKIIPKMQIQALRRDNQQKQVTLVTGLTCLAAAAALSAKKDPDEAILAAITRLEQGRMLIFGSVLVRREENKDLQLNEPHLHSELEELQTTLNSSSYEQEEIKEFSQETANRLAETRIRTSRKIDSIVKRIQSIPRFKRFRMPLQREDYINAAKAGPIIILCATELRSDAIIIQSSGWEVLGLPRLGFEDAKEREKTLQSALSMAARMKSSRYIGKANATIRQHCQWMWTTFVEPILSHLRYLEAHLPNKLPRIHLICCDVLSTFPIHAAGNYNIKPKETAMKYCVSSYATTIKSLIFARQRHRKTSPSGKNEGKRENQTLLTIAMPNTPGQTDLKATEEIAEIKSHIQGRLTFCEPSSLTRDEVLSKLRDATIAHFACHGLSDPFSPSQSRLLLTDHQKQPLTIGSIEKLDLASSRLAYLSACHSAVSLASDLSSEAINIASGFQLAGFPSVIGTLWQAFDDHAVSMAGRFYAALVREMKGDGVGGELEGVTGDRCARALHSAVAESMREDEPFFIAWASWIHIGD